MPDQLILDLAVAVPRLPASIRPMLPKPATEPFDSGEHLFEPTWGGLRALAFVEPEPATGALGVRFLRADGRDVTAAFPDLAALPDSLGSPFVLLDGELVVPDGSGHADGRAMAARLSGSALAEPQGAAVFLAFDLLYAEGRPLLGQPLSRRRQLLRSLVTPGAEILVVPAIPGDGRVLFEAAVAQRLPGILARHIRGPYLPGRRSSLWRAVGTAGRAPSADATEGPATDAPSNQGPVLALIRKLPLAFEGD